MADHTDNGPWELAGAFRAARREGRWVLLGGEEQPDALVLSFVVQHPDDDLLVRRVSVRLPLSVDGADLIVAEPEFVDG